MGDAAGGGVSMANDPNLTPALYDPRAPAGQRYTELAQTLIARMLHSTAGLTTNGTVLVRYFKVARWGLRELMLIPPYAVLTPSLAVVLLLHTTHMLLIQLQTHTGCWLRPL